MENSLHSGRRDTFYWEKVLDLPLIEFHEIMRLYLCRHRVALHPVDVFILASINLEITTLASSLSSNGFLFFQAIHLLNLIAPMSIIRLLPVTMTWLRSYSVYD